MASALVLSGCATGQEPPNPSDDAVVELPVVDEPDSSPLPDVAEPLQLSELAAFSGIVALNAGSNCTGTFIDTGIADGPAYVLTNGHCVGGVGRSAQSTTVDLEWFGEAGFLRAAGKDAATVTVEVEQIAYSTMHRTDTAILRLDATVGELEALGLVPVPIADAALQPGDAVTNVGVPVQDLPWEDWVLRRGECSLGEQHNLIEFSWIWEDVWANDCPGIIQGSSGSPLLRVNADGAPEAIVAMINTTSWGITADMGGACFMNRPCQVTDDGPVMVEQTSYAQAVAGLNACFDPGTGHFALTVDCPLPTTDVWAVEGGGSFRGGAELDSAGFGPTATLVGAEEGEVVTVTVPLGDGSACRNPDTYVGGSVHMLPEAGEEWSIEGLIVTADLPETEGWFVLCAMRGDAAETAATVLFEVDRTPPVVSAGATVEDIGGAIVVLPHLDPPELSTVRFTWGPVGVVDCSDTATFQDFFTVPLTIDSSELPALYCVYGMDAAGNATEVVEIPLEQ